MKLKEDLLRLEMIRKYQEKLQLKEQEEKKQYKLKQKRMITQQLQLNLLDAQQNQERDKAEQKQFIANLSQKLQEQEAQEFKKLQELRALSIKLK